MILLMCLRMTEITRFCHSITSTTPAYFFLIWVVSRKASRPSPPKNDDCSIIPLWEPDTKHLVSIESLKRNVWVPKRQRAISSTAYFLDDYHRAKSGIRLDNFLRTSNKYSFLWENYCETHTCYFLWSAHGTPATSATSRTTTTNSTGKLFNFTEPVNNIQLDPPGNCVSPLNTRIF